MSDRTDQKLRDVVVARYLYRHEAEFAAGFLDDAEIPYRLQVDDAAMGMTIATPATLWVRGADLREALEVLDLAEPVISLPSESSTSSDLEPAWRSQVVRRGADGPNHETRLTAVERTIAAALSVGAAGIGTFVPTGPGQMWVGIAVAGTVAITMGLSALIGRTLPPIKSLLNAISGSVP